MFSEVVISFTGHCYSVSGEHMLAMANFNGNRRMDQMNLKSLIPLRRELVEVPLLMNKLLGVTVIVPDIQGSSRRGRIYRITTKWFYCCSVVFIPQSFYKFNGIEYVALLRIIKWCQKFWKADVFQMIELSLKAFFSLFDGRRA